MHDDHVPSRPSRLFDGFPAGGVDEADRRSLVTVIAEPGRRRLRQGLGRRRRRGGGGAAPTVNDPFMFAGCASQMNVYVPSTRLTENVFAPIVVDCVLTSTPGPWRWKSCSSALSSTVSVYGPRIEVGDAGAARVVE